MVDVVAVAIDRDCHREVLHFKFVNRFHAQVGKANHFTAFDRACHEISCTTNCHEICAFMLGNSLGGGRAALGLTDACEQTLLKHHVHELVHARGSCWPCWPYDFLTHRIDGSDIIDHPTFEADGQLLTLSEHISDPLVRCVASG